jgi:hypothetical protein
MAKTILVLVVEKEKKGILLGMMVVKTQAKLVKMKQKALRYSLA